MSAAASHHRGQRDQDDDLAPLHAALRSDAAGVAEALLGPRNRAASTRATHRWGSKGSFAVEVAGRKQGLWFDHETGEGGNLLALIGRVNHCDFAERIAWARNHTGIAQPNHHQTKLRDHPAATASDDKPVEPQPVPKAPSPETDQHAKAASADLAKRIAYARRLAAQSVPIAGTLGEIYLKQTRGIRCPPNGWPTSIRWHPGRRAVLAIATLSDGSVEAVQRIHVDLNGEKVSHEEIARRRLINVKVTNGLLKDAVVRFPGNPTGPLCFGEGPETTLAVYAAVGFEIWCALGPVGRMKPPLGRLVVVIADDNPRIQDPKRGAAAKALRRAVRDWRAAGVDVIVVYPWSERRHDKTDFATLILDQNAEAVRVRIMKALEPPLPATNRVPVAEARVQITEVVEDFFSDGENTEHTPDPEETTAWAAIVKAERSIHGNWDFLGADLAESDKSPNPDATVRVNAVRVEVGVGKSSEARRVAAETLVASPIRGTVVMAVPTHKLADEQAQLFAKLPITQFRVEYADDGSITRVHLELTAAVWRGREALDPEYPNADPPVLMCQDLDRVRDAQAVLANPETAACRKTNVVQADGSKTTVECPFYNRCGTQRQKRLRNINMWFVPHELLFGAKPAVIGDPLALIVDESAWQDGLRGVEGPAWTLTMDSLAQHTRVFPNSSQENHTAAARLDFLRTTLLDALREMPEGPLSRAILADTDLNVDNCAEAIKLEWACRIDPKLHPGLSRSERKARVEAAQTNQLIPRRVMLWETIRSLLAPGGPPLSGWAALTTKNGDDGSQRVLILKGRKKVGEGWGVSTLLLNATLSPELNRHFWPNLELKADIQVQAPHQHIWQVVDRAYASSRFVPKQPADGSPLDPKEVTRCAKRLRELRAILIRVSRPYRDRGVLVVLQQAVEAALLALGPLPAHITTGHHNAVAGQDGWRDVGLLIIVGRTQPPPRAVERLAEAITGQAITPLEGWYGRRDAIRERASGRHVLTETDFHPDPVAEAIRWQICEGELVQIIGRGRGVNRTAANPLDVLILTDVVLPIAVEGEIYDDDLKPSPADLMLSAGGVALANPTDAALAYPDLWRTMNAAKMAMQPDTTPDKPPKTSKFGSFPYEHSPIGESHQLPQSWRFIGGRLEYQRHGQGQQVCAALFDPALCSDPVAFLTQRLGKLKSFQVFTPDGPPVQPEAEPDVSSDAVMDRALARMSCGVLPLSPAWLWKTFPDLFPSRRSAERRLTKATIPVGWRVAVYQLAGQRRPSKALIRADVVDPRAALEQLLGAVVTFRMATEDNLVPLVPAGYGTLLEPKSMIAMLGGLAPYAGMFRAGGWHITLPAICIPLLPSDKTLENVG